MPTYHSQYHQDALLDRCFFRGMRGGVFVDIGAYDGVRLSNSLTFEADYGWSGLLIEANPAVFPALESRRVSTCLNIAIAARAGDLPFYRVAGAPEMLSGLVSASAPWHRDRVEREIQRDGGALEIIKVPARPLGDVLSEHNIDEVHYLSVDTEGNEPEILASIDHDRVFVHVVSAECNKTDDLKSLRDAAGPQFRFLGCGGADAYFVNRKSPFARRALSFRLALAWWRMRQNH